MLETPLSPSSPLKRHVHFADSHTIVEYVGHRKELTQVEKHQLWWRPSEFQAIMNEALDNAFETRKHRQILCDGLDQALQRARRMAHIVQDDDPNNKTSCSSSSNSCSKSDNEPSSVHSMHQYLSEVLEADLGLRVWSEYGPTRRGLERLGASSEAHQYARDKITRKGVAKVVAFSQRLRDLRRPSKQLDHQQDGNCELVRRIAEHTSRSSVIFARMMGLADAHAAGHRLKTTPEPMCHLLPSPSPITSINNSPKKLPVKKLPSRSSRQASLKSDPFPFRHCGSAPNDVVNVVAMTTRC